MPDLPPMNDALLDDSALADLFRDVQHLAQLDEIIIKTGPGHVNDQQSVSLEEAQRLLTEKSVRGVQLRYRHQNTTWWDTLMPTPNGVRLVRIKHDFDA